MVIVFGILPAGCESRDATDSMVAAKVPLQLRLGVRPGSPCEGCAEFAFEGVLGDQENVLANPEPDLTLGVDQVAGVIAWKAPDGFHITVIANEQGVGALDAFAEKATDGDIILVSSGRFSLGTFSAFLLKASHGILGFAFKQEENFSQVLSQLGVVAISVTESTDEQLLNECSEIAGSDAVDLERCRSITWSDVAREKESLRSAEKLLESADPEDRDAAIESLLKD